MEGLEGPLLTIITASTPLLLAALGELVSERSGVLNLGIEGMMAVGAVCGFAAGYLTGEPIAGMLAAILAVPVAAYATPELAIGWIHPATLAIPVLYGYGLYLTNRMRAEPMWEPVETPETQRESEDDDDERVPTKVLWRRLVVLAGIVGVTGWVIGQSGLGLIAATGWPSSVTGFTVTTAITSLPELVTLIAAVRMGALTLGVGNIIGGNLFDSLMIPVADAAYTDGTIYEAAGPSSLVLLGGTALMTAVLAAGLLVRERKGIGFEGLAIPAVYGLTVAGAIAAS